MTQLVMHIHTAIQTLKACTLFLFLPYSYTLAHTHREIHTHSHIHMHAHTHATSLSSFPTNPLFLPNLPSLFQAHTTS